MPKGELKSTLLNAGWPQKLVSEYLHEEIVQAYTPSGKTVIKLQDVSKNFGTRKIISQLSLDIQEGEIFGIIGASGTGKTTLMNLIMGIMKPDAGNALLALPGGLKSVTANVEQTKNFIGFSTQDPSFYADLTVEENLIHFALLYGKTEKQAKLITSSLSKLVGLQDARQARSGDLSGGMKKRLDIACALVHNPKVLLLDEPVADLDIILRTQLWDLLKDIQKKGTTILIVSHFLTELEKICDRMGILRNGKVAEIGTPDELRVIYSHNFELKVETKSRSYKELSTWLSSQENLKIAKSKREATSLIIQTGNPDATVNALMHYLSQKNDSIVSLDVGRPTVRELFEELLK
jgi:ABC-2 type transport system ATP-binding protein